MGGRPALESPTGLRGEALIYPKVMQYLANPGAITWTTLGFVAAPTTVGTVTDADAADSPYNRITSGAVLGNIGSLATAFTVCRGSWIPEINMLIKLGSTVATSRI